LSKEHIWSEWTHGLLGTNPANNRMEDKWIFAPSMGSPKLTARNERPGQTATKQLRVVCERCNNGWMSRIENAAAPVLGPVILGRKLRLDVFAQKLIATWIALKTFIIEHNDRSRVVASQAQRTAFRDQRTIPAGMRIWIAQCGSGGWRSALYWEVHTMGTSEHDRPGGPNTQSLTFGMGPLLIHVLFCTVAEVDLEMQSVSQPLVPRIFPSQTTTLDWPPPRALTPLEANFLAQPLNRLSSRPGVRWIE
jgi:hypothetical protein